MTKAGTVIRGRLAFERRDWGQAYAHFVAADRNMRLEPEDIERLASAAYLIGNEADAKSMWMRLHHEFVDRDEFTSAARIGFWLSLNFLISGDIAQANGWLSRSQRLIKDGADCAAHGYGCMVTGLMAMGGGNIGDGKAIPSVSRHSFGR